MPSGTTCSVSATRSGSHLRKGVGFFTGAWWLPTQESLQPLLSAGHSDASCGRVFFAPDAQPSPAKGALSSSNPFDDLARVRRLNNVLDAVWEPPLVVASHLRDT